MALFGFAGYSLFLVLCFSHCLCDYPLQTDKLAIIQRITSVEELEGYETESRRRGQFPGETAALMQRRIELLSKRKA